LTGAIILRIFTVFRLTGFQQITASKESLIMSAKVRIGLVGLGQRGLQHLSSLWRIDGAQITALCDPFPDNLAEAKIQRFVEGFRLSGIRTYSHFDEMLAAGGLDALYFCIPPGRHDGELIRAAQAGIHIFAEKPVSLFLDEAVEMNRAINKAKVINTVGFNQRHDNWHTAVHDFLQDKRLVMTTWVVNSSLEGHSVKHTRSEDLGGPSNRVWAANMAWSGSTVVEAGIHQLDLMRYWAGDVAWTQAHYIHRDPNDIEDGGDNPYGYSVRFGFAQGMIGNLLMTRLRKTFYPDGYDGIIWDHGHIKLERNGPVAYYYDGPYPPTDPIDPQSLQHPLTTQARNNNTFAISEAFVAAVAAQDQNLLLNTFASSMNSLAAVLGANISDQLGGKTVDLTKIWDSHKYAKFRHKPTINA